MASRQLMPQDHLRSRLRDHLSVIFGHQKMDHYTLVAKDTEQWGLIRFALGLFGGSLLSALGASLAKTQKSIS